LLDKRAKCAINNFLQEITNVDEINKRIIELLDIWKTNIYKYILYTSIYKYIQDSIVLKIVMIMVIMVLMKFYYLNT